MKPRERRIRAEALKGLRCPSCRKLWLRPMGEDVSCLACGVYL
jgi:hypothetical protein